MTQCVYCAAALEWRRPYIFKSKEFRTIYKDEGVYTCAHCGLVQADVSKVDARALDEYYKHIYRRVAGISRADSKATDLYYSTRARGICDLLKESYPTGNLQRVFELGPGYGQNLRTISREFPSARIFSDELDEDLRSVIGAQPARLQDGGFDAIILSHVLEHFTDPVALIRNAVEALAPNGAIVIEVPNDYDGRSYCMPYDEPHFSFFTTKTLRPILEMMDQSKIVTMFTVGVRETKLSPYRRIRRMIGTSVLEVPYLGNMIAKCYIAGRASNRSAEIREDERGVFLRAAMVRT